MGVSVLQETLPQPYSFRAEKEELFEVGVYKKDTLEEICKKYYYSLELSRPEGFQSEAVNHIPKPHNC